MFITPIHSVNCLSPPSTQSFVYHPHSLFIAIISQAALQLRKPAVGRLVLQQKDLQRDLAEAREKGGEDEANKALEGKLKAVESRWEEFPALCDKFCSSLFCY